MSQKKTEQLSPPGVTKANNTHTPTGPDYNGPNGWMEQRGTMSDIVNKDIY